MFQVFLFMVAQFYQANTKDVTVVDVFEAVGKHSSGTMSSKELRELELVACPSAGVEDNLLLIQWPVFRKLLD